MPLNSRQTARLAGRFRAGPGLAALWLAAAGTPAAAQSVATAPGWLTGGYNGAATTVTQPFVPSTRDANGNRIVSNGEITQSGVTTVADRFGALTAGAQAYLSGAATGAGAGTSAYAFGNLNQIQVTGTGNTVIATVTQTKSGTVTAASTATVSSR